MIRVGIVDDEPLAAERLQRLCALFDGVEVVGVAGGAREAVALVRKAQPDVLLLDIDMPEVDGLAFARDLRSSVPVGPSIVFVTAHEHFAVAAFALEATDYLLKPASAERLEQALRRALASPRSGDAPPLLSRRLEWWVLRGAELTRLTAEEVDLVEAERDYVRLHAGARSFLVRETMASLEQRLDTSTFVRVHRSLIVRREHIRSLRRTHGQWKVTLANGRTASVGRTFAPRLRTLVQGERTPQSEPRRALGRPPKP